MTNKEERPWGAACQPSHLIILDAHGPISRPSRFVRLPCPSVLACPSVIIFNVDTQVPCLTNSFKMIAEEHVLHACTPAHVYSTDYAHTCACYPPTHGPTGLLSRPCCLACSDPCPTSSFLSFLLLTGHLSLALCALSPGEYQPHTLPAGRSTLPSRKASGPVRHHTSVQPGPV